jgi:hypothetical protein
MQWPHCQEERLVMQSRNIHNKFSIIQDGIDSNIIHQRTDSYQSGRITNPLHCPSQPAQSPLSSSDRQACPNSKLPKYGP